MVLLLSIDVGVRNLAMCLMDTESKDIHQWEVDGVPPKHDDGLWLSLTKHLGGRPWLSEAHVALIERQPTQNKVMKQVERFLHGYLYGVGVGEVLLWDAKHKIPDICGPGKRQYTLRKKAAIERCGAFIEQTNPKWVECFKNHCKRDDMADTVMQALSWINRLPPQEGPQGATKPSKKCKPRKPTQNQLETRYSKANLAWCYLNDRMDKRFQKDLGRYYHNLAELKREFELD